MEFNRKLVIQTVRILLVFIVSSKQVESSIVPNFYPPHEIHLSSFLGPQYWRSLIVFTNYIPTSTKLSTIDVPFIIVEPEIYSHDPEWGFSKNQSHRLLTVARLNGLFTVVCMGVDTSFKFRLSSPITGRPSPSRPEEWNPMWGWMTTFYAEPNPTKTTAIYPQTVIFLKPYTNPTHNFAQYALRSSRFLLQFLTPAKPFVYYLNFYFYRVKNGNVIVKYTIAFANGSFMCSFCFSSLQVTNELQENKFEFVPITTCPFHLSCWRQMEAHKGFVIANNTFAWQLRKSTMTLSIYPDRKPVQRIWSMQPLLKEMQAALARKLKGAILQPTSSRDEFDDRYHLHLSLEFHRLTADEFVFITSENITRMKEGIDKFIGVFDSSLWYVLAAAIAASSLTTAGYWLLRNKDLRLYFVQAMKNAEMVSKMLIDQYPTLALPNRVERTSVKVAYGLLSVWLLAIVIISNAYKGMMTSNTVTWFPYKTDLENWWEFENFSLFGFLPERLCHQAGSSTFKNVMYLTNTTDWEAYLEWEAGGRQGPPEVPARHKVRKTIIHRPNKLMSADVEDAWRFNLFLRFVKAINEEAQICAEAQKKASVNYRCWQDARVSEAIRDHFDMICPNQLDRFVGDAYLDQVRSYDEYRAMPSSQWDLHYFTLWLGGTNYTIVTDQRTLAFLYWLTRKPKAAFVVHRSEFPFYWNLFKKAMSLDNSLKFAHTGGPALTQMSKWKDQGPLDQMFVSGPLINYQPEAEFMLIRARALTTSGLISFWGKWDRILRPPRNESASEEISETSTEAVPIFLRDSSTKMIFRLLGIGLCFSVIVFGVETRAWWPVVLTLLRAKLRSMLIKWIEML